MFNESDKARLRGLCDFVEAKYRALDQSLDVDERTCSEIVVPMLLGRTPNSARSTITRGKLFLEWTLKDILDSLLTDVELWEDHILTGQRGGTNEGRKGPQKASVLFTKKGGDKRPPPRGLQESAEHRRP